MRFFLVGRDRSSGEVRLVAEATYATRDEALGVLADESASEAYAEQDLFVVDLDATSPVVFVRTAPKEVAPGILEEPPVEEPIADVWEAPIAAEEGEGELPPAETAPEESALPVSEEMAALEESLAAETEVAELPQAAVVTEVPVESEAGEEAAADYEEEDDSVAGLAEALRKAAYSMEESGVVAPPSVEEYASAGATDEPQAAEPVAQPADHPDMWPWEAEGGVEAAEEETAEEPAQAQSADEVLAALAAVGSGASAEDDAQAADVPLVADEGAGVGEDSEALVTAENESRPAEPTVSGAPYMPVGIEEAGMEEISLLTPADPDAMPDVMPSFGGVIEEAAEGLQPDAPPAPAGGDELEEVQAAVEPSETSETSETEEVAFEPAEPAKAYEPEDDMSGYTCDDCVYVDTCPKHHQDAPSSCGTFQWKPV